MRFLIVFLLLCFGTSSNAQVRTELLLSNHGNFEEWYVIEKTNNIDFITIALTLPKTPKDLFFRTKDDQNKISDWNSFNHHTHQKETDNNWISELYFLNKNISSLQVKTLDPSTDLSKGKLTIYFGLVEKENNATTSKQLKSACPCIQPNYLDRLAWCPNGDCPKGQNPASTEVTHLIVHHAASTNVSSNWSGVVRSIWDFHVNTNGWDDIGYNWLIDPNGKIYEGRGDDIRGAHFCGTNTGTAGICMLGDFQNQLPQQAALDSLTVLLSWKICDKGLDPLATAFHNSSGLELNRISGHRQGCNTACPGDEFFPLFGDIRNSVSDYIDESCDDFPPPTGLTATLIDEMNVELNWQDNSQNEDEFIIERSKWNNSNFEVLESVASNITNYLDETVIPNAAYFYRIKAANDFGNTTYSNQVGIATVISGILYQKDKKIKIFPNPTREKITILAETEQIISLQLIGLNGTILKDLPQLNTSNLPLDLSEFSAGKYFILIHTTAGDSIHTIDLIH